ncbi:MAG: exodeoxyribonuclease V subunit gamma, partial [Desulfurivibrionaceae bacterium]|nr:exodeoxyribonuclease V subunit gamma [Desulfurivibrionaceae bacterium]
MPLYLYTSNRLEKLAAVFAELVAAAPLPPLIPETVILQSGGMARWLNMRLAERLGVSANMVFPFPNGFVGDLFGELLPESALARKLDKKVLKWQLMRVLPELLGRPEFVGLEEYLAGNRDLKRYQLAGRLADLFDQYTIFRPAMILDWEEGGGDTWQALLWRELAGRADCLAAVPNRARLQKQALEALDRPVPANTGIPSRLTVFGLSTIPPYYLKIFAALARDIEVHIFFLNPCREYWGDIVSEKTLARVSARQGAGENLYLTQGNPLLASTGLQGRELLNMLLEFDFAGELELFVEPGGERGGDGMLTALQGDILALRDGSPRPGRQLAATDRSIMVHSCHSPMRELEVLHDQLLGMFEEFADLGPHEIIVMTPDIEAYGPLIDAVFASRKVVAGRHIPFSIADRSLKREGTLFNAFLHLLELAGSRMEVGRVMAALEKEPVRGRFALSLKELELIGKWIAGVNIRWGIDGEDRRRLGLPATVENTWRFGLDRLLLGYAMVGRDRRDFAGILPFDDLEGGQVEALGRFLDFATGLFTYVRQLTGKRSLTDWAGILLAIFSEFFEVADEQENERQFIVGALTGLREVEANGDFGGVVEFDDVMA